MNDSALTILFPTDYSPCSVAALRHALALACAMPARLLVVHVAPAEVIYPGGDTLTAAHGEAPQELLGALQESSTGQPLHYEHRVLVGDPVVEILEIAEREQATLIVMGTTGRSGFKRLLMGSVAEAVVRRASCPVLTFSQTASAHATNSHGLATIASEAVAASDESAEIRVVSEDAGEIVPSAALDLVNRAANARASDVHVDPVGKEFEVRFRVDGRMRHYCRLSEQVGHSLMMQLKVLGNLDIADPFHCKEGRLRLPAALTAYEVRITVVHVTGGEAASLRLLQRDRLLRPLDELGFSAESLARVRHMLQLGEGLIMITGPSGAGKTTTAYSMLQAVDDGQHNIVTIEDPVEFYVPGFRQVDVDQRHGVTMTIGLRTSLRLDPDVLLLGEVRDREAADTAMRAASSGKYVFTTLHTRDVASTATAFRDLSIDNRSLAGNLTGVVSQRLVRRVCRECCRCEPPTDDDRALFAASGIEPPATLAKAHGCGRCHNLGYWDRVGVFEVVLPTGDLIEKIVSGVAENELRSAIRASGTPSLLADGLVKVREGLTTLEEIRRMTWVEML